MTLPSTRTTGAIRQSTSLAFTTFFELFFLLLSGERLLSRHFETEEKGKSFFVAAIPSQTDSQVQAPLIGQAISLIRVPVHEFLLVLSPKDLFSVFEYVFLS
jgi:hypothetical protein